MTRIVIDPDELLKVARFMTEAADERGRIGRELRSRTLPAMPAAVAATVASGLDSVARNLEDAAARLETEAVMLRLRAAIFSGDNGTFAVDGLRSFARSLEAFTTSTS